MNLGMIAVLTTIMFFVLKVTGVLAWSWWWVFSPLLFALGLTLAVVAVAVVVFVIAKMFASL